jgi:hypothetical protein
MIHAMAFVRSTHRRLPKILGGMWAVGLYGKRGALLGVAVVGRPSARLLDNKKRLEITRVAVRAKVPNGCSMLYGACSRAAKAMGATDLLTYIHSDELGASVRAANFVEYSIAAQGPRDWRRGSVSCGRTEPVDNLPKRRFFAPWSDMLKGRT